jgi:hypothetical protein
VDDGLSWPPPATAADDLPPAKVAAKSPDGASPEQARGSSAPEAASAPARGVEFAASDSAADMMVKIAKDYQNSVLDSIKLGLSAALDCAKDFAEAPDGSDGASKGQQREASREGPLPAAFGEAAAAFQAEVLELMKANVATSLEHARELTGAKSAAELVELSATRARKQCELLLKQADALKSLAQSVTRSAPE